MFEQPQSSSACSVSPSEHAALASITRREVVVALRPAGFWVLRAKGSHHFMQHSDGHRTGCPRCEPRSVSFAGENGFACHDNSNDLSTHMNYELDPVLNHEMQNFGKWLEQETERQKEGLRRVIALNLCGYAVIMILVIAAEFYFPLSDQRALSMVIATCSFCIVCALKSVSRSLLLSGFQTSMNIRWLGTILHDLRKDRQTP